MKLKTLLMMLLIAGSTAMIATGCKSKPKDADIKAKVESALASTPGISVEVHEGAVTLSGEVADEASKSAAETTVKALEKEGVSSVTNNLSVAPPPAPVEPVVIAEDTTLTTGVNTAIEAFPGVRADVNDGVIILRGEIARADLSKLVAALSALKPKKIENQLVIK